MRQVIAASILFLIGAAPLPKTLAEPSGAEKVAPLEAPAVVAPEERLAEIATWALERFEHAGLELPAVEVYLHTTNEGCGGHRGIFSPGTLRIDVCVDEPGVVLHELAHAWAHVSLEQQTKDAYVLFRDLESWNDPDTPWMERGSEDAADTVAWALQEPPLTGFSHDGPIARNHQAYLLLTGSVVPRPNR